MNRRSLLLSSLGLSLLPPTASAKRAQQKWALLIGIDQYSDTNINALAGASNDAAGLQETLVENLGFPAQNTRLLSSQTEVKPTTSEIIEGLSWLRRNAQPGDIVVVAFSGHGIEIDGVSYLLPYDTKASDDSTIIDTALEISKFQTRLRSVKASIRLYIFDMCRTDPRRGKDAVAPDNKLAAGLKRGLDFSASSTEITPAGGAPPAILTLMACSEGERSWEWPDRKRGFFSYYVEQGLRGEAADETGTVTLASLKDYVGREVPKAVRATIQKTQTPLPSVTGNDQAELLRGVAGRATQRIKPTTARLSISRLPEGAVVKIDGQPVSGEYREDLMEKTKNVQVFVSASGYKPFSGQVEIRRGEVINFSPTLDPLPLARLVFSNVPDAAVVKIDGKIVDAKQEYGEELTSATKTVELSVVAFGYRPYLSDLELRRGERVAVSIKLAPNSSNAEVIAKLRPSRDKARAVLIGSSVPKWNADTVIMGNKSALSGYPALVIFTNLTGTEPARVNDEYDRRQAVFSRQGPILRPTINYTGLQSQMSGVREVAALLGIRKFVIVCREFDKDFQDNPRDKKILIEAIKAFSNDIKNFVSRNTKGIDWAIVLEFKMPGDLVNIYSQNRIVTDGREESTYLPFLLVQESGIICWADDHVPEIDSFARTGTRIIGDDSDNSIKNELLTAFKRNF